MTLRRMVSIAAGTCLLGAAGFTYYTFGAFLPWNERNEAERLAQALEVREGQTIAEIGAGGGRFSLALAQRVGPRGRVYATELGEAARAALRARAEAAGVNNVTVVAADRLETRLPDGCCDVVLMRNVYHHVTQPEAFGAAVRKALKDGGRLAVIDFDTSALWFHGGRPDDTAPRRPGHGVSRATAIAELSAAGFQLETEIPRWSGPLWLAVFRAR